MKQIKGARVPVFLTVVLVLLGAPGLDSTAWAQAQTSAPTQGENPRELARFQFGVLYLSPSISIDRMGYDSNVLNANGDTRGDFTLSITPRSRVWIPFARRALLTTDLGLSFVYYKDSTNLRSVRPQLNAMAELFARRLTFFAEASVSRDLQQPNIEIEQRVRLLNDGFGGGVRVALLRSLTLAVGAYRRTTRFDGNEAVSDINLNDTLGRVEQGVRLVVRDQLTSLTAVSINFETREDRFDRATDRNAGGYRVSGTIELAPKALISGTAEIGYRHLDPVSPFVPEFDGLVAKVGVANRIAGTWESNLGWDRDVEYSLDPSRPYFITSGISAHVRRQVAGQFDTGLGASRTRSRYRSLLGVTGVLGGERLTSYTFDVGYRLSRDSRAALGVTRTHRTSGLSDNRSYSTTLAALSLNYVF